MTIHPDALADTVPGACARLGVSRTTLYENLKSGALRGVKAGGRTLIPREAQAAWLASLPAMSSQHAA